MEATIQLSVAQLREIIELAEINLKRDDSLSNTVEIYKIKECETHTGGDTIRVYQKSGYAECVGTQLL